MPHAPEFTAKERAVAVDRCRKNFYFYSRWMMLQRRGIKWIRGKHHKEICDALMAVYRGEITRLVINIPPRYSKTQLVTDFINWALGHEPDSEFMYLSYSANLAQDKTADALLDIQHPAYKEIFPALELTTTSGGHWKTSAGGVVYASGTEGTITGFGAGKKRPGFGGALIVDDPHKPDQVFGPVREKVIGNFQRTIENRLNSPMHTPIIVIMQCLHEEDLSAFLLEGKNGENWVRVCQPAINLDGTALWPEMHSIERLQQMQKASPYTFSGQYMQKATPVGGAYFSEAHLLIAEKTGAPVPQGVDCVFAIIDSAVKTGATHDGCGVAYYALSVHGLSISPLTLLDWDIHQIEGALLKAWIPNVFRRLEELAVLTKARYGSVGAWIEDKYSGSILLQQCANDETLADKTHAIESDLTALGKTERCLNVSGYVHEGQCKITQEAYDKTVEYKGSTKNHLMSQILRFNPSTADQGADDLLDCFSYGCALALGNQLGF